MKNQRLVYLAAIASAIGCSASGQLLFSDNFDGSTGAGWTVNTSHPAGSRAIFGFDYSTVGIPAAPGSLTTQGLMLQANRFGANPPTGVFSGLSVSPTGQSFTGDYRLTYQVWHNYHGPVNGGGNGSTQVTGAGVGTAGTTPQWAGAVYDSLFFGATGDGGASQDFRVYPVANLAGVATGYYAAGTGTAPDARNNTHPYYEGFGGNTAPGDQLNLFPQQTGSTGAGVLGFEWHDVVITKEGNTVTWDIDGLRIASVDTTGLTFGGDNILFTHFDINANSSTDPLSDQLLFGLIDNVTVTVIPEPSACALLLGGLSALLFLKRRNT